MNQNPSPSSPRAVLSVWGFVEVASLLLCAATAAGFLARLCWVLELASHFRLHLAVGLGGLALLWALKRRWRMVSLCGVGAVVNAVPVLLVFLPVETTESHAGTWLRLVSLNVHTQNERSDLVLKYLQGTDADVILLLEVNEAWMNALRPLGTNYAQVVSEPREDNFGIALFSRLPFTNSEVLELGQAEVPSIATTISVGGQEIFLLGTHPLPPGSAAYARRRNEQLKAIAALVRRQGRAVVVLGDLNCTPWSPHFSDLLRDGGLKNASPQRGLFGSWPAALPFGCIPLDHALVSPNLRVMEKRLGPPVGSDHLPLLLKLQLPTDVRGAARPVLEVQALD